jgi:isopenicillin N synthase-like dioxygenase
MGEIKLIDLTPARLGGSAGAARVAAEIDQACRDIGFFSVHGHGIDQAVFDDAYRLLKRFFALPVAAKAAYRLPDGVTVAEDYYTPYGYSGLLEENAFAYMGVPDQPSDYVEKYSTGRLVLDDAYPLPFAADELGRELRRSLQAYYRACERLAADVTRLLTIPLGLPREFFAQRIDQSNDSLRAHLYPAYTGELDNDQGMGQHTDGTLITLLTHTAPAIQVRSRDGSWFTPPFVSADHFLVNIGDLLAHWTNGTYVSTEHRVVLSRQERQSIVFFKLTNEDEMVEFGNKPMDALFGR